MTNSSASHVDRDREAVRRIVGDINDHWRAKRYDQIGDQLAEGVVVAPPGTDARVRGRDAYVQSYRDYDAAATTLEFLAAEPQVDVIGDVAIARCPFDVTYVLKENTYRERGHDILVFSRSTGDWKVVWRTMHIEPGLAQ
jgi:ketosteroid isomerase-like protein